MESRTNVEPSGQQENESFRFFEVTGERFETPFQHHEAMELTLIVEGTGLRVVGDSVTTFGKGDLCLLGPSLPHVYHSVQSGARARALVLQFRRDCCGGVIDLSPELARVANLLDGADRGLRFGFDAATVTLAKLNTLGSAIDHEIICQFLSILGLLTKTQATPLASESYRADLHYERTARMHQAYNFILDNAHRELPQDEVAHQLGMKREAFGKFFQRQANQTYRHFLLTARLNRAALLLVHTDQGINDIAEATGFGNKTNFNRRFRAQFQVNPRGFRKLAKQIKAERSTAHLFKSVELRKLELRTQLAAIRSGLGA